MTKFSNTSRVF